MQIKTVIYIYGPLTWSVKFSDFFFSQFLQK